MTVESFRILVFRTVARHLSFSRAAEELLLTQPAVSQQVKALEDEVGVPLFERAGGRVALTPGGAALLPFAERAAALGDEATAAVAGAYGRHAGELTLAASQTIAQYLLPRWIAEFARVHPNVRISARSGNTDQALDALTAGDVQLALIEGPDKRKDVRIEPFLDDRLVLIVPAGHEWADHDVTVADLAAVPLLTREFGSGSRRVVERALAKAGLKAKDRLVGMVFDTTEGLIGAVEAGLGATFVSRWAVRRPLALGTVRVARTPGLMLTRRFALAHPAGPAPVGPAGLFRTFLIAATTTPFSDGPEGRAANVNRRSKPGL